MKYLLGIILLSVDLAFFGVIFHLICLKFQAIGISIVVVLAVHHWGHVIQSRDLDHQSEASYRAMIGGYLEFGDRMFYVPTSKMREFYENFNVFN